MSESELLRQLGNKVRSARKKAGLFQWQLAEQVGIYRQSISEIECGIVSCHITTLHRIAIALQMDIKDFL